MVGPPAGPVKRKKSAGRTLYHLCRFCPRMALATFTMSITWKEPGKLCAQRICKYDLEGIVAKNKSAPYLGTTAQSTWYQIRNSIARDPPGTRSDSRIRPDTIIP